MKEFGVDPDLGRSHSLPPVVRRPMPKPSPWIAYYESQPDGRFSITEENLNALESAHPDRSLFAELGGKTERVLILDMPFRLEEQWVGMNAYHLERIRLSELPGWLPTISTTGKGTPVGSLGNCKLMWARFKKGATGRDGLEITLQGQGETFNAWLGRCPALLLNCVAATLNQRAAIGKKWIDLQNLKLISAD